MGILTDWLTDWLKEILIEGIMGNLTGLFDTVNTRVGEIAVQVGTTPAAWNAGVFSLIRQLSETVILPIAGLVLTFVATYELIQLLIEKNNLHDLDYWIFFKWIFKTACAILVLSNTFNIVNAVFDVSQSVIARAGGVIQGSTDITPTMLDNLEATLETMGIGSLLGLFMQSLLIHVTMWALNIIIFVIVYGRMLEIYMMTSLAPIPVATLANREVGSMGQNYLKSLFAVGFQGLLILLCVGIYAVLVQSIATTGDPIGGHLELCGLYSAAGLYAVQNRVDCEKHIQRSLRRSVNMAEIITSGQIVPKITEGLHLMDGIEGLRSLPRHSVDMLLTDPPYGTTKNYWDTPLPLPELWEAIRWAVKPNGAVLLFAQCPFDKALGLMRSAKVSIV